MLLSYAMSYSGVGDMEDSIFGLFVGLESSCGFYPVIECRFAPRLTCLMEGRLMSLGAELDEREDSLPVVLYCRLLAIIPFSFLLFEGHGNWIQVPATVDGIDFCWVGYFEWSLDEAFVVSVKHCPRGVRGAVLFCGGVNGREHNQLTFLRCGLVLLQHVSVVHGDPLVVGLPSASGRFEFLAPFDGSSLVISGLMICGRSSYHLHRWILLNLEAWEDSKASANIHSTQLTAVGKPRKQHLGATYAAVHTREKNRHWDRRYTTRFTSAALGDRDPATMR
ncbi:hypothetical protein Nepgr_007956 [Nepenthes gracilis]|uniref:Uncharacterized protein n=1 Tax=Nepenthes gracilis TaxID=150966 RepID=A0AAD3S877_NEPGR|nr:hypothetical protein Nepgr_007956 [Nepenthes gracilis]